MASRARVTVYRDQARREALEHSFEGRVEAAGEIVDRAKSAAPVYSGAFRGSIDFETQGDRVFVVAEDEDSMYIEYGTEDTPAFAALTESARPYGKYRGWQPRGGR